MNTLSGYRHFRPDGAFGLYIDPVTKEIREGTPPAEPSKPRKSPLPRPRMRRSSIQPRAALLLNSVRVSARRQKVACTLTMDWFTGHLVQCDITGCAFEPDGPRAPTVFRTRPGDYTPENCLVVCRALARALGTGAVDDVAGVMRAWLRQRDLLGDSI